MLNVNREALSRTLAMAQTCVESKGTIPVLAFALLQTKDGKLTITTTDLDVTIHHTIQAEGDDGAFCVPAQQLHRLVGLFEGEVVSLAPDKNTERVVVSCGKSKYTLPSLKRDSFPNIEEVEGKHFPIKADALKLMLDHTVFCVSTDAGRLAMNGVFVKTNGGKLSAAASDGYRLAVIKYAIPFSEDLSGIIPTKAVKAVVKTLNDDESVSVTISGESVKFTQGDLTIRARLVIGQFPNYELIIPKERKHSVVLSDEISKVFKRSAVTADRISVSNAPEIFFTVSKDGIEVTSRDSDKAEGVEIVEATCKSLNGESVPLKFASNYVSDVLAREREVNLAFDDNNSQIVVTPTGAREYEYKCVFMPCRI